MSTAEESTVLHRFPDCGIDSLVVFLRQRGFRVGASEAIDAAKLVRALARQPATTEPEPGAAHAWLAPKLRPIFCKNRDDQQRFDAIFDEWWAASDAGISMTDINIPSPSPVSPAHPSGASGHWRILGGVLLIVVFSIAAFFLYRQFNPSSSSSAAPQAPALAPAAPPAASATAATPIAPTLPAADSADAPFDGFFPQVRYHTQWRPWVGGALLAVAGLAFCALLLPLATPWLGHAQRSGRPIALDDSSLRQEAERIVPPLAADVAARLARHVPGPADSVPRLQRRPLLDVGRTLEATLRQLGILRLRYRRARLAPSYLLLIDGDEQNDPRSRLFYHWAQRLQREGIDVDIRLLRLDPATGNVRLRRPGGRDGETLDLLPTPPVGQRLIVISDGTLLVDERGRRRDWLARARLHRWPERVLFTPREPRRWDAREAAIERPERSADPGFIVLPIDENALAAWSELIVSGRLPDFALSRPQRYPRLLRRAEDAADADDQGEQALLADTPPFTPAEIIDLLAQLKLYLGENGYYWLCVCAIPPIVRWQLTLLLGEQYLRNAGVDDAQLAAYIARYYGRLASLPWLRRQKMPDWLRLALLDSLPAAIQDELRQVVLDRLGQLRPADGGGETLHLEEAPGPLGRLGRLTARERSAPPSAAPGPMTADTLYLGFLAGHTPRQLMLRAPRQWSSWLPRLPKTRRSGLWRDRLSAWRDRLFWRDGLSVLGGSPRRRLWMASIVTVVAGAVGWLGDPANLPPGWRQTVYVDRAHAVALPQLDLTGSLSYSPDGQRLLTIAAGTHGQLWDAGNGQPLGAPLRGTFGTLDAAFSADGRILVSRISDRELDFRDGRTGESLGPTVTYPELIAAIGFVPAGLRVVTSGAGHATRLWDGQSGQPIAELLPEAGRGTRIQFSVETSRLLTAGADDTPRVWDAGTGQPSGAAVRLPADFRTVVFSPDQRTLAFVGIDRHVRLWDIDTGRQIGADLATQGTIHRVRFSPDGRRVLTASDEGRVQQWDAGSGQPLGAPIRHDAAVYDAAFSPDGRFIATASADQGARLWDSKTGAAVGSTLLHPASVSSLAFAPDGRQLATASFNQSVRLWTARPPAPLLAELPEPAPWRLAAFSPDGERLLTAGYGRARLSDSRSGQPIGEPLRHDGTINDARFSADGQRLVTASDDGTARLWDGRSGQPLGEPLRHQGAVRRAVFSPDGERLATASADRQARLWNGRTGQALGEPLSHADTVNDVAFSADGQRVLTASDDGTARLWDVASRQPLGVVLAHPSPVSRALFCADDRRIVTVSLDHRVRLWDSRSGTPLGEPMSHSTTINDAACSADGRRIVSASLDNSARLWDGETGQPLGRAMRHDDAVWHAVFSPDGRQVLTASADRSARLWDGQTGEALGAPLRHPQAVRHAAFSADGERLVTAWGAVDRKAARETAMDANAGDTSAEPSVTQSAEPSVTQSAQPSVTQSAQPSVAQSAAPAPSNINRLPGRGKKAVPKPADRSTAIPASSTDSSAIKRLPGNDNAANPPMTTIPERAPQRPSEPAPADGATAPPASSANSPAIRRSPVNDNAANPPATAVPERPSSQQQAPLRGTGGAFAPTGTPFFDLFPAAWADGTKSAAPDQQNMPAERSPEQTALSASAMAVSSASGALTVSGAKRLGGATVWPVQPLSLPVPESRPPWLFGGWLTGLLGAYLSIATALGWHARRQRLAFATRGSATPTVTAAG